MEKSRSPDEQIVFAFKQVVFKQVVFMSTWSRVVFTKSRRQPDAPVACPLAPAP